MAYFFFMDMIQPSDAVRDFPSCFPGADRLSRTLGADGIVRYAALKVLAWPETGPAPRAVRSRRQTPREEGAAMQDTQADRAELARVYAQVAQRASWARQKSARVITWTTRRRLF